MSLKKKLKRMQQELLGTSARAIVFPPEFTGKNWSALKKALTGVKPSQKLKYYRDFRLFIKEIKIETIYE